VPIFDADFAAEDGHSKLGAVKLEQNQSRCIPVAIRTNKDEIQRPFTAFKMTMFFWVQSS